MKTTQRHVGVREQLPIFRDLIPEEAIKEGDEWFAEMADPSKLIRPLAAAIASGVSSSFVVENGHITVSFKPGD